MSLSLFAPLLAAAAAPLADLDAMDRQVAAFTGAPAGTPGGAAAPVDRRLRLNSCRTPLSLSWRGERRDSVVVRCPDTGGWRLFVPVRTAAPAERAAPAVNRGDAVTIAVEGDGFAVSQPGEALDAGTVGEWVRVRAAGRAASAQTTRAQVVRPGLVAIPLP
ncbi:MAG: flagella basal body P-ring formation protein FlgA [Novosphingobium sp.]|nr:flagella basal body P-ring formation protein FlgA [Novosphingobium sp.]